MAQAIIIYDTKYGNTEKVARSLEQGLKETGIQTLCKNAKDIIPETLRDYDLIAVGAPTQIRTASTPIKEFLSSLKFTSLAGKYGFAFDTKFDSRISGSAAKYIEKKLQDLGLKIIEPCASAVVKGLPEKQGGAKLKDLEETLFHHIGLQLGTTLTNRMKLIPA